MRYRIQYRMLDDIVCQDTTSYVRIRHCMSRYDIVGHDTTLYVRIRHRRLGCYIVCLDTTLKVMIRHRRSCCERVHWRAGAAGEYGSDQAVLPWPPPLSPAPGVRVPLWREGAACGCGERARRAYAAASGCSGERVLRAGAARASAAGA